MVIVPLYTYTTHSIQTDPRYSASVEINFDPDATLFCSKDWGNRHGRFYSPESLKARVLDPVSSYFACRVYEIKEPFVTDRSDTNIYVRLALYAERL